jgi:phage-related tail protein
MGVFLMQITLLKSKTVWTAIVMGLTAVGGMATGELSLADGLQALATALIAVFLRDGISKGPQTP